MSGRWLWAIVALCGIGLTAAGPARSLFTGAEPAPLPTLVASRSNLVESTVALGALRPQVGAEVKVGSRLSGVVARLEVGVGDRVTKGDLLAALRDDDWRAKVDVLKAELAAASAETEFAAGELARTERQSELVPALQIDALRRNLAVRRATVERVRANLAAAEIDLGYTVIRAPVAGTVASVSTYVGETIAASLAAPTFVTLVDLDRLEVQAWVDETDIGRVEVGQAATLRVDAYPERELPGRVRAIYPKAELVNNVVTYVVIVDVADVGEVADRAGVLVGVNSGGALRLRPEMTVHVELLLEQRENVVVVPRGALLQESGRTSVVVDERGRWVERPVELGLQTPQRVEIASGLEAGETIVADKQAWKTWREKRR